MDNDKNKYENPEQETSGEHGNSGAKALSKESSAIDFVRDAFGHLKAIAVDKGGQSLLKTANIDQDAGIVNANDKDAFIAAAKSPMGPGNFSVNIGLTASSVNFGGAGYGD